MWCGFLGILSIWTSSNLTPSSSYLSALFVFLFPVNGQELKMFCTPPFNFHIPIHFYVTVNTETPGLWPPHAKSWLIGKDSDSGRDWGQGEKGTTEDEMAGWHHCLDGHDSEWTLRVGDGQGGLACCGSWGRKESDTTERLNWTELNWTLMFIQFLHGKQKKKKTSNYGSSWPFHQK